VTVSVGETPCTSVIANTGQTELKCTTGTLLLLGPHDVTVQRTDESGVTSQGAFTATGRELRAIGPATHMHALEWHELLGVCMWVHARVVQSITVALTALG